MRSTLPLIVTLHPIELLHYRVWLVSDGQDINALAVIEDETSIKEALVELLNNR